MIKHFNIKISGLVQGVFFRHSAKARAEELGILGFARNEPGGSVYIEAEGEEASLKEFLDWCRRGPDLGRVEKVEVGEADLKNFGEFSII